MDNNHAIPTDPLAVYELLRTVSEEDGHICFIFGAGASAGYSRNEKQFAPPVVASLFDDSNPVVNLVIRRTEHDAIMRRRDDIIEAIVEHGGDLEAYLGHLFSLHQNNELFTRLLLYLQDLCFTASANIDLSRTSNNYLRLIYRMESLRGTKWSSITFNYDTILEKTIIATGSDPRDFTALDDYLLEPRIIKVHGGINVRYQIIERSKPDRRTGDLFRLMMSFPQDPLIGTINTMGLSSTDHMFPVIQAGMVPRQNQPNLQERLVTYNFPVMMVPIHNTNREHNAYFGEKLEQAMEEISRSALVIAIGYNFGDRLFVDALKRLKLEGKTILLVGGADFSDSPTDNPGYNIISSFWKGPIHLFKGAKFTEFVNSIGPAKPAASSEVA
jgi:hypothetical protein